MRSDFIKRAAVLTASNLLLQLMAFAYRMALTALAGTEALGLNSLIMQVYSVVVAVCISGLSVAVTSCAARLAADGNNSKKSKRPKAFSADTAADMRLLLLRSALLYCLLWFCAALPVFCLRGAIAKNALGDPGSARTLALMLVCIFMTGLENVLKSIHLGTGLVSRCAVSELIEQGARFLLVIELLSSLYHGTISVTVFYIMLGMTLSELVSVGFLLTSFGVSFGRKKPDKNGPVNKRSDRAGFGELVSTAAPASATALASTVFASAAALLLPSRLVMSGMGSSDALSLIGVMSAVAAPITLIPMAAAAAVSSVLMPETAARAERGECVLPLARRALILTALLGAAATAVLVPIAPFAAQKLFGVEASPALFAALGLKAAVLYPQIVSTAVLNGAKKQRTVLVFAVTGEAYQLGMMLLLTPVFGVYGYIAAMILGEALRLACSLIAVSRLH